MRIITVFVSVVLLFGPTIVAKENLAVIVTRKDKSTVNLSDIRVTPTRNRFPVQSCINRDIRGLGPSQSWVLTIFFKDTGGNRREVDLKSVKTIEFFPRPEDFKQRECAISLTNRDGQSVSGHIYESLHFTGDDGFGEVDVKQYLLHSGLTNPIVLLEFRKPRNLADREWCCESNHCWKDQEWNFCPKCGGHLSEK